MSWVNVEESVMANPPNEREKRQVVDLIGRKARPRFYADENFPPVAVAILRRRKADVLTVQEARQSGHPDENHAARALRLGRVLITCDRDYLDERKFPLVHCPAIVVCDFGPGTSNEILKAFDSLGGIFAAPQFFDKWTKIHTNQDCWTEYIRCQDGSTSRHRYRVFRGRLQEWIEKLPSAARRRGRRAKPEFH